MSEWTLHTLKHHLETLIHENDLRYQERWAATQEAISKAEQAAEKRFDSVNEFRAQLSDQARDFMPRKEYEVQHSAMADRVAAIERILITASGEKSGLQAGWAYLIGALGTIGGLVGLIVAFHH